jgi:hypothetical protein
MKNTIMFLLFLAFLVTGCSRPESKIKVYAWTSGPGNMTDSELISRFEDWKSKGVDGLLYQGGHDPANYSRVGKIARQAGLEFQAWIPTMVQGLQEGLTPEMYAVNGLGESAFEKPAYVDYYKFLCPNREEVYSFLSSMYGKVADVPEVDAIHLDYIRYPDVILAKGLWNKYGLVMDREYPQFDYCYCDTCVERFKQLSGIDIKSVNDPSTVQEWKQYRYDLITNLVAKLSKDVHAKNKMLTAAVFPGPHSVAEKIVRQQWHKWDIDMIFPMNYNDFYLESPEWVGAMVKEGVNAVDNKKPIFSGLFICPNPESKASMPDPENHGLTPDELGIAIDKSMENGAAGICLFTPERMTSEHWEVLRTRQHKHYSKQ